MSYGGVPFAGGALAGQAVAAGANDALPILAVEVAFTTNALATPAWVDITGDVREWDTTRGRNRELERFQPGRATIVLDNLDRRYDSSNAAGPWFGNLKPMRRVRIRETFNGVTYPVFDGFVDKWQLDYPQHGKDATATIVATDAFKIFARTDLPLSVYEAEVAADNPVIWWRLDETGADPTTVALNKGSLGTTGNGTYIGPVAARGEQGLIFHDPGTAIKVQDPGGLVSVPDMGVHIDRPAFNLNDTASWAIEFWAKPAGDPIGVDNWVTGRSTGTTQRVVVSSNGSGEVWRFQIVNAAATVVYGVTGDAAGQVANTRYHIVAKYGPNQAMAIYVNGTKYTTTASGNTAPPVVGAINDVDLGFFYTFGNFQAPEAIGSQFAVYTSALGVDPLPDDRVTAHFEAATAPWNSDLPGARIDRVLDEVEWPDDLRELDDGATELQSTPLRMKALEHLHKVSETEFGLLYVDRAGNVRFVARSAVFGRTAAAGAVFGDDTGEIGYRGIKFDDGDEVIRNRATITQLNGIPAVEEDTASVTEFGRFDYDLDGLYHDSLTHSQDYAEFIVAEYKDPRRRVVSLTLGPAEIGAEDDLYPQILGRELGETIVVRNRPPGVDYSDDFIFDTSRFDTGRFFSGFEQTCTIEGIRHRSVPPGHLTTTWILSPEMSNSF